MASGTLIRGKLIEHSVGGLGAVFERIEQPVAPCPTFEGKVGPVLCIERPLADGVGRLLGERRECGPGAGCGGAFASDEFSAIAAFGV